MMQAAEIGGIRIGTAGWSISKAFADYFPEAGSHLERYSAELACVEVNSSFYRPHRPATYARWAQSTPHNFRFSVKLPKAITHDAALVPSPHAMQAFIEQVMHLGDKLGPILVQLPPRQRFDPKTAHTFFACFRDIYPRGTIVFEPRHPDWFSPEASQLLRLFKISRVLADPLATPAAAESEGDTDLIYHRLHGSPRVYYSSYSQAQLGELARRIAEQRATAEVWCIFDNTAVGAAVENAFTLRDTLTEHTQPPKHL